MALRDTMLNNIFEEKTYWTFKNAIYSLALIANISSANAAASTECPAVPSNYAFITQLAELAVENASYQQNITLNNVVDFAYDKLYSGDILAISTLSSGTVKYLESIIPKTIRDLIKKEAAKPVYGGNEYNDVSSAIDSLNLISDENLYKNINYAKTAIEKFPGLTEIDNIADIYKSLNLMTSLLSAMDQGQQYGAYLQSASADNATRRKLLIQGHLVMLYYYIKKNPNNENPNGYSYDSLLQSINWDHRYVLDGASKLTAANAPIIALRSPDDILDDVSNTDYQIYQTRKNIKAISISKEVSQKTKVISAIIKSGRGYTSKAFSNLLKAKFILDSWMSSEDDISRAKSILRNNWKFIYWKEGDAKPDFPESSSAKKILIIEQRAFGIELFNLMQAVRENNDALHQLQNDLDKLFEHKIKLVTERTWPC